MPIRTEGRFFGEGLSSSGVDEPGSAFRQHRRHVRQQRLYDLLGKSPDLSNGQLADKFEEIAAAISAADEQVVQDNAAFMKQHGITL